MWGDWKLLAIERFTPYIFKYTRIYNAQNKKQVNHVFYKNIIHKHSYFNFVLLMIFAVSFGR